jgi:hypothetical protein
MNPLFGLLLFACGFYLGCKITKDVSSSGGYQPVGKTLDVNNSPKNTLGLKADPYLIDWQTTI